MYVYEYTYIGIVLCIPMYVYVYVPMCVYGVWYIEVCTYAAVGVWIVALSTTYLPYRPGRSQRRDAPATKETSKESWIDPAKGVALRCGRSKVGLVRQRERN